MYNSQKSKLSIIVQGYKSIFRKRNEILKIYLGLYTSKGISLPSGFLKPFDYH